MTDFDYANPTHRMIRTYRTRAIRALLFAADPDHRASAPMWNNIAESWTTLADIRERECHTSPASWPRRAE